MTKEEKNVIASDSSDAQDAGITEIPPEPENPSVSANEDTGWKKAQGGISKPEVGDITNGELIKVEPSKRFPESRIYTIKKSDTGQKIKIFSSTVLADMMEDVEIGDLVKITRLEDKPSENGKPMKNWNVLYKRRSG